ncbi:MAG: hypothetical protein IPM51_14200 [Sphingobacteriaceae bacterium]|nr:hypothetical protein [Sphingobacteriaceae bacterium]
MINRFWLYILFLLYYNGTQAQDHGFFNQVWLEEGLSQSSINSILQDKNGFVWFATQDGLNRYDGRVIDHFNFKPFAKESISGDDVFSMCQRGDQLFLLNDKGLDAINQINLKIINYKNSQINNQPVYFRIWNINDQIYLSNREGLFTCEIKDTTFITKPLEFKDSVEIVHPFVLSICQTESGNTYASTNRGLFINKKGTKLFKKIANPLLPKASHDEIYSCLTSSQNKILFANAKQLFCLNETKNSITSLSLEAYNSISCITVDKRNNIWLGTSLHGLFLIKDGLNDSLSIDRHFSKTNSRFGLQSNQITSLYQNSKNNSDVVWIGTRDAGAFNYSYSKNSFSIPTSFVNTSDPNFFGITKDKDGIIWAGYNSGILKLNREKKAYSLISLSEPLKRLNRPVEALCTDKENRVWFGYGNSLYLMDKQNNIYIQKIEQLIPGKNNQVSKISVLNENELLICTAKGLVKYNIKSNETKITDEVIVADNPVKIENVISFLSDSKENWWFGGAAGVYCIRKDGGTFILRHNNSDSNSILSNRVLDIKESADGNIVLATTKGLSVINSKGEKIKNIFSDKNLSNNFIYGILNDDSGKFWLSTNYGLSVYNPTTEKFKSYSASDGIFINEFNSNGFYKAEDGELLFGGLGGIVSVYPQKQVLNKNVSSIILRRISTPAFQNVDPGVKLNIPYWQNDIYFEFSIPDFSGENNIDLYYRFKNRDTNLIKVNTSKLFTLSFINIAPGSYNLEVIAINKEGAKSAPFNYSFSVSEPFWSTWWFYLILVAFTVILSWLIYRTRLRRKIEYIQQIEIIRKEESEKVRKAAALDLHDEFGNGLTRISMLIEMIKLQMNKENGEANKLLEVISQNTGRLYQGTKDFIWSINPGKDNIYEIVIRIKDYADEVLYGTNINFKQEGLLDEYKNIRQTPTAGRNITMIFKECLSNILKHAKANEISFSIQKESDRVKLILEDNGVGFEMKDYKNSFGISNMYQRAMRSSAELKIDSVLTKGTKTTVIININATNNESHD